MNLLKPITWVWDKVLESLGERKFYPILLGVLIVAGFFPLLMPGIPGGHDICFHLTRLLILSDGLKNGCFPVWVNIHTLDGFGYAPGLFYSDLFLYPSAFLIACGIPLVTAYKLYLFVWGLLTAFSMYYVVLRIGKSTFGAFAGALLYCWSSYFAVDVFNRAALGEVMAFLFVPWCILGLYEIIYGERRRFLPLALGFAGLFYSHTITFVLMSLIAFLLLGFHLPLFLKDFRRVFSLVAGGIVALLLVLAALVPLGEQMLAIKFNLSSAIAGEPIAKRVVPLARLFLELPYMKLNYWIPPGVGMIFIVVLAQRFRLKSNWTGWEFFRDAAILTGLFALLASTDFLPWEGMMSALGGIQFPWRFYMPATAFLAVGGGLLLGADLFRRRFWCYVLLLGCGFAWFFNVGYTYAAKIYEKAIIRGFSIEESNDYAVGGSHYLPKGKLKEQYAGRRGEVIFSKPPGKYSLSRPAYGKLRLEIDECLPDTTVELPLNPYVGYRIEAEGGEVSQPDFSKGRFLVHIKNPASHTTITTYYRATAKHNAAMAASTLVLAGLGVVVLIRRVKRKNT